MQQPAPVSPELFWDTVMSYQKSAAIKAAVDLEVFSNIGGESKTAAEIATATGAAERGIRILCDSLTVMGFLTKAEGGYSLTDSSATFLDKNSPAYIGSIVNFLLDPALMRGFEDLTGAVKKGGTMVSEEGSVDPESPMWVKFANAMMPMMVLPAQAIAEKLGFEPDREVKVLDIAAGHGIFGITILQKYPNAQVYAADWANVLTVATENAEKFGVADRHHLIPGNAFESDLGSGYDVILLTNFLHHFDKETCEGFLRKLNGALAEGGRVITLEFIPNDDRVTPPAEAMFSLVMLAGTPGGDAYTFAELKEMFENAGFSKNEHVPLEPTPQHLVVSQR